MDKKADRPFRDTLQEASAPLLSTGGDEGTKHLAQAAGEPAGIEEPKAEIPKLVNLLETGAHWLRRKRRHGTCSWSLQGQRRAINRRFRPFRPPEESAKQSCRSVRSSRLVADQVACLASVLLTCQVSALRGLRWPTFGKLAINVQ